MNIRTPHLANWSPIIIFASSRVWVEVEVSTAPVYPAAFWPYRRRERRSLIKLEVACHLKSRLLALRFGVHVCTLGAGVFPTGLPDILDGRF